MPSQQRAGTNTSPQTHIILSKKICMNFESFVVSTRKPSLSTHVAFKGVVLSCILTRDNMPIV